MNNNERTRELLLDHYRSYPKLRAEDIFKYLYQSAMGCEHLVTNQERVLAYIKKECEALHRNEPPRIDPLDGDFCRVHLSCIGEELSPEELARLFCLSAEPVQGGAELLEQKIAVARALVDSGELPIDRDDFYEKLKRWRGLGYPAMHHSEAFREAYHPAYRVIANRYLDELRQKY